MVIDNVNPEFASSDSKNECTRTKTISSLPEVSTGMAALNVVTFENRSISRTRMELVCTNDNNKVVFHLLHGQLNIFLVGNLYYSMLFHPTFVRKKLFLWELEDTAGYAGLLLASAKAFLPFGQK